MTRSVGVSGVLAPRGAKPRRMRGGRWLLASAVAVLLVMPTQAQHGGGHAGGFGGGGHIGGFAGGGRAGGFAGGYRGGVARPPVAPLGSSAFPGRPGYPGSRFAGVPNRLGVRPYAPVVAGRGYGAYRPGIGYGRGPYGGRFGYGPRYGRFVSVGVFYNPFLFNPLWGFGDPFWYPDASVWPDAGLSYGYGYDGAAYGAPAAAADDSYQMQAAPADSSEVPSPETEPGPWAPQNYGEAAGPQGQTAAPPVPRRERLTTIVYRDGRPPEQIRNYALTRSALLVTGPEMREIPLDEIDLPATERVNRAAGVDFRLPQSY